MRADMKVYKVLSTVKEDHRLGPEYRRKVVVGLKLVGEQASPQGPRREAKPSYDHLSVDDLAAVSGSSSARHRHCG